MTFLSSPLIIDAETAASGNSTEFQPTRRKDDYGKIKVNFSGGTDFTVRVQARVDPGDGTWGTIATLTEPDLVNGSAMAIFSLFPEMRFTWADNDGTLTAYFIE